VIRTEKNGEIELVCDGCGVVVGYVRVAHGPVELDCPECQQAEREMDEKDD
jgi:hypothetical protein